MILDDDRATLCSPTTCHIRRPFFWRRRRQRHRL